MKPAAYLLAALLFSVCAVAQDYAKPAPPKNELPVEPGLAVPLNEDEAASLLAENTTCYTVRAYFFKQSEAGTLEPAGMTTCVRSSQRALKRVQKKPPKTVVPSLLTY